MIERGRALPRAARALLRFEAGGDGSASTLRKEARELHAVASRSSRQPVPAWPRHDPPLHEFLEDLQREMRRTERSCAPLSLVVYRFDASMDPAAGGGSKRVDALLALLHSVKRETDMVGLMGDDKVAVLCPDTDEAGLLAFVGKIEAGAARLRLAPSSTTATYPDDLFDSLSNGTRPLPQTAPFLVSDGDLTGVCGYRSKRWLDVIVTAAAICFFAPLMMAVALAIAGSSPGPVIFRQTRLGKGGVPFTFYKFRSMKRSADDSIHRDYIANLIRGRDALQADDAASTAGRPTTFKLHADPRITWIGRLIRKTSIDELPQLFNVLRGDMSLVGPRPPIPYEAAHYQSWHLRRILSLTPGITGLWQVEGRSRVTFNAMVRMDLRYRRECSLGLDIQILLRTVLVVIRCKGAA